MNKITNLFKNKKFYIVIGAIILFLLAGSGSFTYMYLKNPPIAKNANTTTNPNNIVKPTTVVDSFQADLNNINSKSANLDNEVNSASNGLNDSQTNLVY